MDLKTRDIQAKIDKLYDDLYSFNIKHGYFLNPDTTFTKDLVKGLLENESRYGYMSCPCRLSSGVREKDLDIICPCDYRDADVFEHGSCYCGLYVNTDIFNKKHDIKPIPERRPKNKIRNIMNSIDQTNVKEKYPIWRCNVCGYICARNEAPEICPICGASHDRFQPFEIK